MRKSFANENVQTLHQTTKISSRDINRRNISRMNFKLVLLGNGEIIEPTDYVCWNGFTQFRDESKIQVGKVSK